MIRSVALLCLLLAQGVPVRAQSQSSHASLATLVLVEDEALTLTAPGHVKVVPKVGGSTVEGARSLVEASVSLAVWHVSQGKLEHAMGVLEAGLNREPNDAQLLLYTATIAMRLDDPGRVLELVERGLKRDESAAELHYLRASALHRLGKAEPALDALRRAVGVEADNPRYQCALGRIYYGLGERELAGQSFRAAVTAANDSPNAALNLGVLLAEDGELDEALNVYRSALSLVDAVPNGAESLYSNAYANLGSIHSRRHEWDEALQAYETALAIDPTISLATYNRAFLLYRSGDVDDAESGYRRALELDATLPLAYLHLGEIELVRAEPAAAIKWLERGLAVFDAGAQHPALMLLGKAHERLGHVAASIQAYRAVLEQDPEDVAALSALGALLGERGGLVEARALLERARAQAPEDSHILLALASLARAEGDPDAAKALYRDVLTREGDSDDTWLVQLNLAMLLLEDGETAEARQRLEPLLERLSSEHADSDDAVVSTGNLTVLATVHGMLVAKEGDFPEAAHRLDAVVAEAGSFAPALAALAVLAALDGNLSEAETRLAELLSTEAGSFRARVQGNLGLVLWLGGKHEEARAHLESAIEAFPRWLSVRAALGETALTTGRMASAIEHATEAFRLCTASDAASSTKVPRDGTQRARVLEVTLGGAGAARASAICVRNESNLGNALVSSAIEALSAAASDAGARARAHDLVERTESLTLEPRDASKASFVRGTLSLLAGADQSASRDLGLALERQLDEPFRSMAENNLGVALYRLGQTSDAERHFQAARKDAKTFASATLNLGIARDERDENDDALRLYEEFLASSQNGERRSEVMEWIEHLRRLYR